MKNFKIEEKQWVLKTQTFYCMKKLLQSYRISVNSNPPSTPQDIRPGKTIKNTHVSSKCPTLPPGKKIRT